MLLIDVNFYTCFLLLCFRFFSSANSNCLLLAGKEGRKKQVLSERRSHAGPFKDRFKVNMDDVIVHGTREQEPQVFYAPCTKVKLYGCISFQGFKLNYSEKILNIFGRVYYIIKCFSFFLSPLVPLKQQRRISYFWNRILQTVCAVLHTVCTTLLVQQLSLVYSWSQGLRDWLLVYYLLHYRIQYVR